MEVSDYHHFEEQRDQVLQRLDMYIESVRPQKRFADILTINESNELEVTNKKIMTPKGLERILIELLSNATDHHTRTIKRFENRYQLKPIEVTIGESTIIVKNYGAPIPIEKKNGLYVPYFIFGKLNSSSNYFGDRSGVIGMNGLGSKVANITSRLFTCHVLNADSKKSYYQEWYERMSKYSEPLIEEYKGKENSVTITAELDLTLFGIKDKEFDEETISLFYKTCLDMSFATRYKINVNDILLDVTDSKTYLKCYYNGPNFIIHTEKIEDQEIEVIYFDSSEQIVISFVNGIITRSGGNHVNASVKAIKGFNDLLNSKFKKEKAKFNTKNLKSNLSLIVNFKTDNPEASGQSKNIFEGVVHEFTVPEPKLKKMLKWDMTERFISIMNAKITKKVSQTDGKSTSKVFCKKLEDAIDAGKKKRAGPCTLMLVEGDSAKGSALFYRKHMINGNRCWGILCLKGKVINPCDKSISRLAENDDIINIKESLGLKEDLDYSIDENFKRLRYDNIMILTDQDVDGSHITGLVLNLFFRKFRTLLMRKDFVVRMITPLVRASNKKKTENFYCVSDFETWKQGVPDINKWTVSYSKGLGSNTPTQIKQDSKNPYIIKIHFDKDAEAKLDLAFDKKHIELRKEWLQEDVEFGSFSERITKQKISTFIDNELREYSIDSLCRAIPKVMDGMKKSHVEILWAALNNWSRKDISIEEQREAQKVTEKVSQFANFTSKLVNYHHGEESLNKAIIRMSQSFIGSNNLSYFYQHGIFGTRKEGGDDASQPRYLKLKPLWWINYVYREEDMHILEFEEDEGKKSEPKFMLPIIPMILVNGMKGIATGFSTNIPPVNIFSILEWLINKLKGITDNVSLDPYFRGFKGTIEIDDSKYYTVGTYEIDNEKLIITEVPVSYTLTKYRLDLDDLIKNKKIKDYEDHSDDQNAYFVIYGYEMTEESNIEKEFWLRDSNSLKNFVALNNNSIPSKYDSLEAIIEEYYNVRLPFFEVRRQYMIKDIQNQIKKTEDMIKFMTLILEEKILWKNILKKQIAEQLAKHDLDISITKGVEIMSFSKEKISKLFEKNRILKEKLQKLINTTPQELWLNDLNEFIDNFSEEKFEALCGGTEEDEE